MPRYDYRCTDCDQAFELRQSFSEAGNGVCPQCSGTGRRVFHAVPVIYKGSGFYTTDYGRPKPPVENGSKNEGSESSKSSDSKPAESPSQSSSESSGDSGGSSDSTSTAAASGAETG